MKVDLWEILDPDKTTILDKILGSTSILKELGIDAKDYAKEPEKFIDDIIDHISSEIVNLADCSRSYTAWDPAENDDFSIDVCVWCGIWFVTGREQFDGYFLSEAEANEAAAVLASFYPLPEERNL